MSSRARRLTAYAASMHFIAPGLIALIAVLSAEESQIWRLGTAIGGLLGALVSGYAISSAAFTGWQRAAEALMLALFVLIFLLSFVTTPVFGLRPVAVEALINVGLIGLGVQFVWQFFTEGSAAPN